MLPVRTSCVVCFFVYAVHICLDGHTKELRHLDAAVVSVLLDAVGESGRSGEADVYVGLLLVLAKRAVDVDGDYHLVSPWRRTASVSFDTCSATCHRAGMIMLRMSLVLRFR